MHIHYIYSDALVVSIVFHLYACKELDKLQTANHGQKSGVQLSNMLLRFSFFFFLVMYVIFLKLFMWCLLFGVEVRSVDSSHFNVYLPIFKGK